MVGRLLQVCIDITYAIWLCGYQGCYIAILISSTLLALCVDITLDIHITSDINIPMSARLGRGPLLFSVLSAEVLVRTQDYRRRT